MAKKGRENNEKEELKRKSTCDCRQALTNEHMSGVATGVNAAL